MARLLELELVTNLGIVEAVYNHKVGDPKGRSPIVVVLSAGSDRQVTTFSTQSAVFYFEVQLWVLYADPGATPPWTEADAEDLLDLIEKEVSKVVHDNVVNGVWKDINYTGRSTVLDVATLGGDAYVLEKIPIGVEVF